MHKLPYNFPISFDGTRLDELDGISIFNYEINDVPRRSLISDKIARRNLTAVTSADYTDKTIRVFGTVMADTRGDAQVRFGQLKRFVQGIEKPLTVPQYNTEVSYLSTLNATSLSWLNNQAEFTLEFFASDPFAFKKDPDTLVDETNVTTLETYNFTVEGTAPVQYPIITITLNSITATGLQTITIRGANGFNLEIDAEYEDGDVLRIDSDNIQVTLNEAVIDYRGRVPVYAPGERSLEYTDTFDARDINIEVKYNQRFI